eukprot:scaffold14210_cov200-Alexandrium_tamarense.AAC.1
MADYDDLSELETLNDEIATLKSVLEAVKKAETSPDDACDTIASYVVKNGAKDSFLAADPGSEVNNIYHSNVKGSGGDGGGGCCTASVRDGDEIEARLFGEGVDCIFSDE